MKFVSRKATEPPLGLLTVAAMLPGDWEVKLIDMKVKHLKDRHIEWADMVFISAMSIQRASVGTVIERCKKLGTKIVAGGPLFTTGYKDFEGVDHFVLNEAEVTLQPFLDDLKNGCAKPIYTSTELPNLNNTPVPRWELVNLNNYATINVQYSRGCPHNCEFCDVSVLFGRKIRTKFREQILAELDKLYLLGWRNEILFVDDNFVGNKKKLKRDLLPGLIKWQAERGNPFAFGTEASIDIADDDELMKMMATAGFNSVFVGIETVNEDSLAECNKVQNKNRDLAGCVKKLHENGIMVKGGFIVGFDNDPPNIFEKLSSFIQETGIITAMVGLLNAPRGTRLYQRLAREERLTMEATGDNTDCTINFIPKMGHDTLIKGYREILSSIYSPKPYYERVRKFLKEYKPTVRKKPNFEFRYLSAFFKSVLFLGVIGKERHEYWKLFFWALFCRPQLFPLALTFSIYGFHFRKIFCV